MMKGKRYIRGKIVPLRKVGPDDRVMARRGCGKIALESLKVAKQALKGMVQKHRNEGTDPSTLNIYWCQPCDAWHVGHHAAGAEKRDK